MFEVFLYLYGLAIILCCTVSYQKTWKFFFLFNIGIGIPFYGGALIAVIFQLVPGEMGLRVLLFYFIWPVLNAGMRGKLLDGKNRYLVWLSFTAFWGIGFWLPPVETMVGYLMLITGYFIAVDTIRISKEKQKREKMSPFRS